MNQFLDGLSAPFKEMKDKTKNKMNADEEKMKTELSQTIKFGREKTKEQITENLNFRQKEQKNERKGVLDKRLSFMDDTIFMWKKNF